MVFHSQLLELPSSGVRQRSLRVVFHNQEWQRYKGFICMVSGHDFLHSQYHKNTLQFATRAVTKVTDSGEWQGTLGLGFGRSHSSLLDDSKNDGTGGLLVPESEMFGSGGASTGPGNRVTAETFSLSGESLGEYRYLPHLNTTSPSGQSPCMTLGASLHLTSTRTCLTWQSCFPRSWGRSRWGLLSSSATPSRCSTPGTATGTLVATFNGRLWSDAQRMCKGAWEPLACRPFFPFDN